MTKLLKYRDKSTYLYWLDEERCQLIVDKTMRAAHQVQWLYNLVDGDFEKLKLLEEQIKNCWYFRCLDNKEQVEEILNMKPISKWFSFGK